MLRSYHYHAMRPCVMCFFCYTPFQVSAKEYVTLLLSWVEEQLNNESVFPGSTGQSARHNTR